MGKKDEKPKDELKPRQRLFVEYYLGECQFNGTDAARKAGYSGTDNALAVRASELLRIRKVQEVIASRVADAAMPANEVLSRLSNIARGDVADVLDEDGRFDFQKARTAKKTGLLKKLKRKTTKKQVDAHAEGDDEEAETIETSVVYEEVEFEMYSAHEALRDLGKYHKLFSEKVEHEHSGVIEFTITPGINRDADR